MMMMMYNLMQTFKEIYLGFFSVDFSESSMLKQYNYSHYDTHSYRIVPLCQEY